MGIGTDDIDFIDDDLGQNDVNDTTTQDNNDQSQDEYSSENSTIDDGDSLEPLN